MCCTKWLQIHATCVADSCCPCVQHRQFVFCELENRSATMQTLEISLFMQCNTHLHFAHCTRVKIKEFLKDASLLSWTVKCLSAHASVCAQDWHTKCMSKCAQLGAAFQCKSMPSFFEWKFKKICACELEQFETIDRTLMWLFVHKSFWHNSNGACSVQWQVLELWQSCISIFCALLFTLHHDWPHVTVSAKQCGCNKNMASRMECSHFCKATMIILCCLSPIRLHY